MAVKKYERKKMWHYKIMRVKNVPLKNLREKKGTVENGKVKRVRMKNGAENIGVVENVRVKNVRINYVSIMCESNKSESTKMWD